MNYKVVFILSNGHSGSTMLDLILGSNSQCVSLGEFRVVAPEHISEEKRKRVKDNYCAICANECPVWSQLLPMKGPRYHDEAHAHFGSPVLIDSSKIEDWPALCEKNISGEIVYIRLTRSVYDRFGSFRQKRGKVMPAEVKNWVTHEKQITRFLRHRPHIKMKYEDLCRKTGLKSLCSYIGIDYEKRMWKFWKTRHHNLRGNVKTATLVKLYHKIIKRKDLDHTQQMFLRRFGFHVRRVNKSKYLTEKDIALIVKTGAAKINKELGY